MTHSSQAGLASIRGGNSRNAAAYRLLALAEQVGLTVADAEEALTIGARFLAHGFSGDEINQMILNHYRGAAGNES